MKKIIHNIKTGEIQEVDMTADEVSKAETDKQNYLAEQEAIETARAERKSLKASAKAKLIAGEPLTEAEADTLVL